MPLIDVKVPDIGDFKDIPVIEILVKPGDRVEKEDSLVTLESDKATMDVPSPQAGLVKELKVNLDDKVSQNSVILVLDAASSESASSASAGSAATSPEKQAAAAVAATPDSSANQPAQSSTAASNRPPSPWQQKTKAIYTLRLSCSARGRAAIPPRSARPILACKWS